MSEMVDDQSATTPAEVIDPAPAAPVVNDSEKSAEASDVVDPVPAEVQMEGAVASEDPKEPEPDAVAEGHDPPVKEVAAGLNQEIPLDFNDISTEEMAEVPTDVATDSSLIDEEEVNSVTAEAEDVVSVPDVLVDEKVVSGATTYLLEICVDSLQSAENAIEGGADRLELCASLQLGGLTPTAGLLQEIKTRYPQMPVYCMLRSRDGNFAFDSLEMDTIMSDLDVLKQHGADGFVFGALHADGSVDEHNCCRIINAAKPLPVTFHRAFDVAEDWRSALTLIQSLGFTSLLTSGQAATAVLGADIIGQIAKMTEDSEFVVMAGSGVSASNASLLLDLGVKHLHASASEQVPTNSTTNKSLAMGSKSDEITTKTVTQTEKVKALKAAMARE